MEHTIHCYVCTGCSYVAKALAEATTHEALHKHSTYVVKVDIDTLKHPDDGTTQIVVKRSVTNMNQSGNTG